MLHRKLMFLLGALAVALTGFGAVIGPDAALTRALNNNVGRRISGGSDASYRLARTVALPDGQAPALYIFSRGADAKGYVVASADDRLPALIGYSSDYIDVADMPPAMSWWLGEYARQLQYLESRGITSPSKIIRMEEKPRVWRMVSTKWNQDAPYNNNCPMVAGARSVTGCVATAMAQVMNYHKFPEKGMGSNEYSWTYNNASYSTSMDFSTVSFDWADMLDDYTGTSTAAQKSAVATLMNACGVSVNMQYSPNESGAATPRLQNAYVNYFGYDKGARYVERNWYGLNEWEDLVYDQLKNYGPIQYSGSSPAGGHSFVCDGYENSYYHINWGWGGMSDGWFLLNVLDPDQQGIGGSTGGFNFDQDIMINVRPAQPGSTSVFFPTMTPQSEFIITNASLTLGLRVSVKWAIYNYSGMKLTFNFALKFTPDDGSEPVYSRSSTSTTLDPNYGYNGSSAIVYGTVPSSLPEGTYTVTPAIYYDGRYFDQPTRINGTRSYRMTVSGRTATFSPINGAATLEITNLKLESDVYLNNNFHLTATITNTSDNEFYAPLSPAFMTASSTTGQYSLGAMAQDYMVDILPGETLDFDYIGYIDRTVTGFEPGTFELGLIDYDNGMILSGLIPATVKAAPSKTTVAVSGFDMVGNKNAADAGNLRFNATVNCTAGFFGDQMRVVIYPYKLNQSVSPVAYIPTDHCFVSQGGSAPITAYGGMPEAQKGDQYFAMLYNGNSAATNTQVPFTVDQVLVGVDSPAAGGVTVYPSVTDGDVCLTAPAAVELYNMNGSMLLMSPETDCIDMSEYASGIYLLRVTPADGRDTFTTKIIRK